MLAPMIVLVLVAALTSSASAQAGAPWMTVTPDTGVRPLTVTVTGSSCVTTRPIVGTTPHQIRITWQVRDSPWTVQTRIIGDNQDGASWSTTLVLGVPNIGLNDIAATCLSSGGAEELTYPAQKVEVLLRSPALTASPTSIAVGESLTATANLCPDPEGPILGGGYFVRFRLEYLIPPSGTQGPFSESTVVWTDSSGSASTIFTLPANAPTEGGSYRVSATCELEEFGSIALFNYPPVAIAVAGPAPTPTATPVATATVEPTVTPTPGPSPTPGPTVQPTAVPTSTPGATPIPTATPQSSPTPRPTPRPGGGVIIFTG